MFKNKSGYRYFLAGMLLASVIMSYIFFFQNTPLTRTFSSIGRQHRGWFIAWGFVTGFAVLFNLKYLSTRTIGRNRLFEAMLLLGCIGMILNVMVNETDPVSGRIHGIAAATFVVFTYLALCILLINKIKDLRPWATAIYIFILIASFTVFTTTFLINNGFTAFGQTTALNLCLVMLLCLNFFKMGIVNQS